MIEALSNGTTKGKMVFKFGPDDAFGGLTAARATQMVAHLLLTIDVLEIWNAKYGSEFWDALMGRVKQLHSLNNLVMYRTSVGDEEGGQEVGLRLSKMISSNTNIKKLELD